jgi:hypothetical protein
MPGQLGFHFFIQLKHVCFLSDTLTIAILAKTSKRENCYNFRNISNIKMNHPEAAPHIRPLDVLDSKRLIEGSGTSIEVMTAVDTEIQEKLWEIVNQGFVELNSKSYEQQDMTREEFDHDMSSDRVLKYLAFHDDEPVGFLTVHEGLEDIVWADQDKLRQEEHDLEADGTSFYIGTLVVPASLRAGRIASSLLRGSFQHFHTYNGQVGKKSLIFFDCAEANYPGIPDFAMRATQPSGSFRGVNMEMREFQTLVWVRSREDPDRVEQVESSLVNPEVHEELDRQHFFVMQETELGTDEHQV